MSSTRIYVSLPSPIADRLNKYIESLKIEPARNKIILKALDLFLTKEGF